MATRKTQNGHAHIEVLEDLMTERQVAALFGRSKLTIMLWRQNRELPHVIIPGDDRDAIRYRRPAVLRWAKANDQSVARERRSRKAIR